MTRNGKRLRTAIGLSSFYCTEPQTLILTAKIIMTGEVEMPPSDDWQETVIDANKLINRFDKQPMKNWSKVGKIHFLPKQGSDITKVIFAEFKWVAGPKAQ